jgi:hypothetical protein
MYRQVPGNPTCRPGGTTMERKNEGGVLFPFINVRFVHQPIVEVLPPGRPNATTYPPELGGCGTPEVQGGSAKPFLAAGIPFRPVGEERGDPLIIPPL